MIFRCDYPVYSDEKAVIASIIVSRQSSTWSGTKMWARNKYHQIVSCSSSIFDPLLFFACLLISDISIRHTFTTHVTLPLNKSMISEGPSDDVYFQEEDSRGGQGYFFPFLLVLFAIPSTKRAKAVPHNPIPSKGRCAYRISTFSRCAIRDYSWKFPPLIYLKYLHLDPSILRRRFASWQEKRWTYSSRRFHCLISSRICTQTHNPSLKFPIAV